jgi:hypothetical protein
MKFTLHPYQKYARACVRAHVVTLMHDDHGVKAFFKYWSEVLSLFSNKQTPWPLVHERTIPTERPPLVDEFSANFCG